MKLLLRVLDDSTFNFNQELVWTKNKKIEQNISLTSAEGEYSIDLTSIDNMKLIVIKSDGPFTLSITKDYIIDTISVENFFCYQPSELERANITSIGLTALNVSSTDFIVQIYGEA